MIFGKEPGLSTPLKNLRYRTLSVVEGSSDLKNNIEYKVLKNDNNNKHL